MIAQPDEFAITYLVIAHVGGVPVEELLPAAAGTGTALLLARAWVALRLRRRRGPGT